MALYWGGKIQDYKITDYSFIKPENPQSLYSYPGELAKECVCAEDITFYTQTTG